MSRGPGAESLSLSGSRESPPRLINVGDSTAVDVLRRFVFARVKPGPSQVVAIAEGPSSDPIRQEISPGRTTDVTIPLKDKARS